MREKRVQGSVLVLTVALLSIFVFSSLCFFNAITNDTVYAEQEEQEVIEEPTGPITIELNKSDEFGRPLTGAVFKLTLKNTSGEVVYESGNIAVDEDGVLRVGAEETLYGSSQFLLTIEEITAPKGYVKMETTTKTLLEWGVQTHTITK